MWASLLIKKGISMDNNGSIKTFVIDTNIFIHKADAILSFRDNEVVIPLGVLEELDTLKTYSDERGRNARHAVRFIDSIAKHGDLQKGIKMENGSILRVAVSFNKKDISRDLNRSKIDNHIIQTAVDLQKDGKKVFFVSKDINARVKAQSLGLKAVDYEKQKVNINDLYTGFREIDVTSDTIESLTTVGTIPWNEKLAANEFLILHEKDGEEPVLARYDAETGQLNFVDKLHESISGIKPLNIEQRMALNLLLDDSIHIVTLVGKAGTGKTLLAIASGLHRIFKDNHFNKVLISRPVIPFGKDIGYLPGSKEEKLSHWMQPLHDNMEFIMRSHKFTNFKTTESLLQSSKIEVEALTYIRGRSLPNQYIIIDEAQNLSPHEIKTVVSRAGEGTKVILTGDPYQIDSPYLDSNSNGLTYLVEAFKGQAIYGHVLLEKSERSLLAELAGELL